MSGGATVGLTYGCRSERVLKTVSGGPAGGGTKLYVRGTSAVPIMERSSTGPSADVCYIHGPGGLIAMRKNGTLFSILKDHLGSVRGVLDQSGAVVASYEYLTYGGLAAVKEPSPQFLSYLYTGQEFDSEIGLYNYRTRFYSGELGRFLAIDPARQYFSPYLYASNNPVLYVDPTGMFSLKSFFSAIGGMIIGAIEILIGVAIDIVAGLLDAVTLGLGTPAAIGLAALSGTFYGAGISAITYSVFNINDFSWKDYGINMGIGAATGLFSGGVSAGVSRAVTAGATRVATAVDEAIVARAGQQAATFGAKAVNVGLKATKVRRGHAQEHGDHGRVAGRGEGRRSRGSQKRGDWHHREYRQEPRRGQRLGQRTRPDPLQLGALGRNRRIPGPGPGVGLLQAPVRVGPRPHRGGLRDGQLDRRQDRGRGLAPASLQGAFIMSDCKTYNNVTQAIFDCMKQTSGVQHGTVYDPATGTKGTATTSTAVGKVVLSFDLNTAANSITYCVVSKPWIVTDDEIFNGIAGSISSCSQT